MAKLKKPQLRSSLKQNFTRKEVRELLKKQIKKVRNSVGRMDYQAGDIEVLANIRKCRIVKF